MFKLIIDSSSIIKHRVSQIIFLFSIYISSFFINCSNSSLEYRPSKVSFHLCSVQALTSKYAQVAIPVENVRANFFLFLSCMLICISFSSSISYPVRIKLMYVRLILFQQLNFDLYSLFSLWRYYFPRFVNKVEYERGVLNRCQIYVRKNREYAVGWCLEIFYFNNSECPMFMTSPSYPGNPKVS